MTRYILIIIILIIVVGGAFWISSKQETSPVELEETEDEVVKLLENLKQETNIDFPEMQDVEFDWMVEKYQEIAGVTIKGKEFEAKGISNEQYVKIGSFLKDKGFEADVYNAAAGTISGLDGYRKDYLVCIVIGGASGYKEATDQWIPPELDKKDVEVKCGKGDSSIDPIISKEEAIKRLFAQKYNKKVAEVTIRISQETENHLRGGVEFQPGGPENSGLFLAAKVDDNWRLVFDGQGAISCEEVARYNFPQEMATDCAKTQTIKTQKDDNFSVVLEANPTTGYQWELDFKADYLQLVDREYTPASSELIGSGGQEKFEFLALKSGQTEITFSYLRSWENKPPIEEKVYQIIIK